MHLESDDTKNKEPPTVYLDDELLTLMENQPIQYLELPANVRETCPYVFHREGTPIKDFRGSWDKACKYIDMEVKIFHDLRRNAVKNMVRSGVQEVVAVKISGHKTRAVFDRYNIVSTDDLKETVHKVGAYHEMVTKTVTKEAREQQW